MEPTKNTNNIFDRTLLKQKRDRVSTSFSDYSFLINEVGDRLFDRLNDVNRGFENILNLGAREGFLSQSIASTQKGSFLISTELSEKFSNFWKGLGIICDEEYLPFKPKAFDLVISNLNLHWVNDLPGALIQINTTLKPDGLFLATMFGGDTLIELRNSLIEAEIKIEGGASPRVSPFADIKDMGGLLQRAGFALPVADIDTIKVNYPNAFKLMSDLRGMGESNNILKRKKNPLRRETIIEMAKIYQKRHGYESGEVPATFQIIYLTGWRPHASQQQPLKPGSAKMSLAAALKTKEIGTGEKTGG
jgi:NADH dehydrogenase [ubiquinone] 1 alpha subcomplex assembly factor 5